MLMLKENRIYLYGYYFIIHFFILLIPTIFLISQYNSFILKEGPIRYLVILPLFLMVYFPHRISKNLVFQQMKYFGAVRKAFFLNTKRVPRKKSGAKEI